MEDDGACGAGIIQKVMFGTGGCACGCLKVIIKMYVLLVKKKTKHMSTWLFRDRIQRLQGWKNVAKWDEIR